MVADVPIGVGDGVPSRAAARPGSGVHAVSLRALIYAQRSVSGHGAVFFADDDGEAAVERDGALRPAPLDIFQAPYRDLSEPLLAYVRELTADPRTALCSCCPSSSSAGPRLLHNQRALT